MSRLKVREAMRRLVVNIEREASIEKVIRFAIKYKANAVLVTNEELEALGVVSKTELMGAYYAGFPLDAPLETVMAAPVLFCDADDSLEAALNVMRAHRVHRLYVSEATPGCAVGVLAYPDIVGLLYRYCRQCERSVVRSRSSGDADDFADRFRVSEVMTPSVQAHGEDETLLEVMEGLSAHRLGAVLIRGRDGSPLGVVSKTDLVMAYMHGVPTETPARVIMSVPVLTCSRNEPLLGAVRTMILSDTHRLFVTEAPQQDVVGVLSLSDAARVRSGSCRACIPSRISPLS